MRALPTMTNLLSKLKQAATGAATAGTATATSANSTASSVTHYSASNPPRYVYKILPTGSNAVRYAFPIPIPASYIFPATELDAQDGFMHLSTHTQVPGTLERFFAGPEDSKVTLVRCDYQRLAGWKIIKWEPAGSSGNCEYTDARAGGSSPLSSCF